MSALKSSNAEDAYRLWQLCFGDTDAFLSTYFRELYRADRMLVGYTDGVATTHLQCLPLELTAGGRSLPVNYVVAVCTHPDYAGRGLMKVQLQDALRLAKDRGEVASLLLPAEAWLFDYYAAAAGYAPVAVATVTDDLDAVLREADPDCEGATLVDYLVKVERMNPAPQLLHTPALWRVVTEDYPTTEGYALRTHHTVSGGVDGALFYIERGEELIVQAIYGSAEVRSALLRELPHPEGRRVSYYLRPQSGDAEGERTMGMLRLLCPLRFLQHLAELHPELSGRWAYQDTLFPEVNGLYSVEAGRVVCTAYPKDEASYTVCRSTAELLTALGDCLGTPLGYSLRLFFEAV